MAKPPATPTSSDIEGVDRDASHSDAGGRPAETGQQQDLANAKDENKARPDYDPQIASRGNSQ